MKARIALMTGGGDAPGLNGIIQAVSRSLLRQGFEVIGIRDGFEGVFEGRFRQMISEDLTGIHSQAGTFLGTSNRSGLKGREAEFVESWRRLGAQGLIVAGGDGTFSALASLESEIPLIGVPKTIDNDLAGTDQTFGFDTACAVVADSVDALRATADAHRRILVVETMGRTAGWIALGGGLASYADVILIPEKPFDRSDLFEFIRAKKRSGQRGLLVVVAEGAHARADSVQVAFRVEEAPEALRLGGIGEKLARELEKEIGWESRHVVLGHLQRARHPTTLDRFLTLSMGVEAAKMVEEQAWGQAVVFRRGQVTRASIHELMGPPRRIPEGHAWIDWAQSLGIWV